MFYLDTSVLSPYYCPEPLSETIERCLLNKTPVAISHLTEIEFYSAISKKIRLKNIDQAEGNQILDYFQKHIDNNYYKRIPLNSRHFQKAKILLQQHELMLKILDALHISITMTSDATLVTADKRMAIAANKLSIPVEFLTSD